MCWKFLLVFVVLFLLYPNSEQKKRRRRQMEGWGLTKPTGVPCTFNPCDIPNFCGNGRDCVMDPVGSCYHVCKCLDNITHPDCRPQDEDNVTISESSTTATTDDGDDGSCPPGFPCENGNCVTAGISVRCECHDGWEGHFCETESSKCLLPCPEGQECQLIPGTTSMQICVRAGISTDDPSSPTSAPCATPMTMRPLDERVCNVGLPCRWGWCNETRHDDESVSAQCICDPGFVGLLCEDPCCLDCGEHGACQLHPHGEEYCSCSDFYTGERCDQVPSGTCNGSYSLRPLEERTCTGFPFPCHGGWCNETSDGNGGLSANCICDPGFTGPFCDEPCCLDCGEYGVCHFKDGEETCNCFHTRTGDRCEKILKKYGPPEKVTWYLWVVGVCAVVLFLLLLLLVVIPYLMWRHRVILVMKIVHYFQAYEDNDEREWDAFVSYKADEVDEHFVVHTLYPKLEKELGFKLNLHFRDFIPGETIANNIIRAVQGSRRTILIITPRYVKSEFTRFEYQLAQQEMLKKKHRIIPLILEDVSDTKSTMDPNLKIIMNSVTYLEWPREETERKLVKFWKRLELSLPKKRSKDPEVEVATEVTEARDPVQIDLTIVETPPPKYEDIKFTNCTNNRTEQTNEDDKGLNSNPGDKKKQTANGVPSTTQNGVCHINQSRGEHGSMVELQNFKNLEQARERYLEILETAEQGELC